MGNEITGEHRELASAILQNNSVKIQNLLTSTNLQSHLDSWTPSVPTSQPTSRPISPQQEIISSSSKRLVSEPSIQPVSYPHNPFQIPPRKNLKTLHPVEHTQNQYQSNPVSRIITIQNGGKMRHKNVKFVNHSTEENKSRVLVQQKDRRFFQAEREIAKTNQLLKRQSHRINCYEQMLNEYKNRDQEKAFKISELEKENSKQKDYIQFLEVLNEQVEKDRRNFFEQLQEKNREVEELAKLQHENRNIRAVLEEMEKEIEFKIKLLDESFLRSSNLREQLQNTKSKISQLENQLSCKNQQLLNCQDTYLVLQEQLKQKLQRLDYAQQQLFNVKRMNEKQIQSFQEEIISLRKIIQGMNIDEKVQKGINKQRSKLFERKIIYDLKKQNIRLWNRLIKINEEEAQENGSQTIKDQKESLEIFQQEDLEKQYLQRYEKFMSSLSMKGKQSHSIQMRSSMNESDLQFYRSKCENLEKMVQSHMTVNKEHQQRVQHSLSLSSHSTIELDHLKYELEASQAHNVLLTSRVQEFLKKEEENQQNIRKLQQKLRELTEYNEIFLFQFRANEERTKKIKERVEQMREKLGQDKKNQQILTIMNSILIDCED